MVIDPILLVGGSGNVGTHAAHALRAAHPGQPLLIGGRDLAKAQAAAGTIGGAEGIAIDPGADDLGLGDRRVSGIAVFYADPRLATLRYAHRVGIPHLGISSGIYEIAPEVAIFMQKPDSAAIVLGYEWLVGATTVAALEAAKAFSRVDRIEIGALVDTQEAIGPSVEEDFERLSRMMPAALTRRDGAWTWRRDDGLKAIVHARDGAAMEASGFSSIDVAGLAAETGATDVQFDIASGISSSRRAGGGSSTEILIRMSGEGPGGLPLRTRHALVHPRGTAALTAIGAGMVLEGLTGLGGKAPQTPGLYFPYQVIDHAEYLDRLRNDGGDLVTLEDM